VIRLRRHVRHWLLLALCLGSLGGYLAFSLWQGHLSIESQERVRLSNAARAVGVDLMRQLDAINRTMDSIITELPYWAAQPEGRSVAIRHLKSMDAAMPSVRIFLVFDAQGTVTLSTHSELMGRNFASGEYFQAHAQSQNLSQLHVSAPFRSALDSHIITLTRALIGPDGEFAGVVSASLDPMDMKTLMNAVRYTEDMRAMLVHGDGQMFVSEPEQVQAQGPDKGLSMLGSVFRPHLASQGQESSFTGAVFPNETSQLSVLLTIQPAELVMDKPLMVVLSRDRQTLFAGWQQDVYNQLLVYLLLVLLSIAGMLGYLRQLAQQRISDQRLKLATEATGVGIWELDLKTRRYHWDAAMFTLFGLDPQAGQPRHGDWQKLLLPGEPQRLKAVIRRVLTQREPLALTFQIRCSDGQVRFLRNRAALYDDGQGVPRRLVGTTEDVTERMLREADLRVAATAFESHESMFITDAQGVILQVNQAFTDNCGYTAAEAVGQTPRLLHSGRHDAAFYAAMQAELARKGSWQGEVWNRRKNGEVYPEWLKMTAVCNEDGQVTHFVASHTDVTEQKAAEEDIKRMAFYDPLTSLPNRRLLQDRLQQALSQAQRNHRCLALMFLDLDQFKPVNDALGHQAGDDLLRLVAQRLLTCVRASDTVARMGGDEFVLLLPNIDTAQDALGVAEKIHAALRQPFTLPGGAQVAISSSTGIALYPAHGTDGTTLTSHADAAMYQAKSAGRDRFVLFQATD
jgi:diguanylate cyclase (GGDEF)-like protein/PAS domain S-box-containing protein